MPDASRHAETPLRNTRRVPRMEPLRFARMPALAAAAVFALGILLSQHVWQPPVILLAATLLCIGLTFVALQRALRIAWLPVAAVWVCAGLWCVEIQPMPAPQSGLLHYADGLSRTVSGRVVRSGHLLAQPHGESDLESADIAVDAVEDVQPDTSQMEPVSGGVRLTIFNPNDKQRESK